MKTNIEKQKLAYLYIIRDVVTTVAKMRVLLAYELCPVNGPATREDLKTFALLRKTLKGHLDAMRAAETADGHRYGVEALLGFDPHESIRVCLCVLAAKGLSSEIVDADSVPDLATLCAGREPEGVVCIHAAFGRRGILYEHTHTVDRRKNGFSEWAFPALREESLRKLIGLETEAQA
jgi:hypothetical protein